MGSLVTAVRYPCDSVAKSLVSFEQVKWNCAFCGMIRLHFRQAKCNHLLCAVGDPQQYRAGDLKRGTTFNGDRRSR